MLAVLAIHERVEGAVLVALPDWRTAAHGYEQQPLIPGGAERSHRTFCVALPTTAWNAGRQHRDQPQYCSTLMRVRWLYRIRVEARSQDYRDALDAEAVLLQTVLATTQLPELSCQLVGDLSRAELSSETGPMLLGNMDFVIHHSVNLGGI